MAKKTRDPLSTLFDPAARQLLSRAYARPGTWVGTRLADPNMRQIRYANSHGMYPLAKDDVPGGAAKTRWARAFMRALYHQHKWYAEPATGTWRAERRSSGGPGGAANWTPQGLVVEVGRAVPARGVIPAGRAVRVKLEKGGAAKAKAVAKTPAARIWADQGPAWADPGRRDW